MKNSYLFSLLLIFFALPAFSQFANSNVAEPILRVQEDSPIAKKHTSKAYLDTILYEDFDGSIPTGWTVSNPANNGNDWIWVAGNTPPGGQYSTTALPLNSTSAANGYMMLPSDFYNTPFPPNGPVAMNTWFTSSAFSIPSGAGSILVKYEHSIRYCCSSTNDLVLEVSTDSINWVTFEANGFRNPSTASPNGEVMEINVSSVLGNQTSGYLRFRSTGNVSFYWMIDDILVFEGPRNNMRLTDFEIDFHSADPISPIYTIIPQALLTPVSYSGITLNNGGNTQTNVEFKLDVFMDSTIGGGPGTGIVYADSDPIGTVLTREIDTSLIANSFYTFNPGWYRSRIYVSSDSVNQLPQSAEANYTLAVTQDSVVALDGGAAAFGNATLGPAGYVGGGNIGDRITAAVIIGPNVSNVTATSVSYWVPRNRPEVDDLALVPKLYSFNPNVSTLDSALTEIPTTASAVVIDTCTACPNPMVGEWVTLPFSSPVNLNPGAYYFGIEQTGGASSELWLGWDINQQLIARTFSNIMFLNEPGNARWISNHVITGLRLNVNYPVGIEESNSIEASDLKIMPNPNTGIFTISLENQSRGSYQLKINNSIGQAVLSETINVNGDFVKQLDLTAFDKGIYFISIENGEERLVKKVVVK